MYKQVMLLGLLMERPMYGQQIREVIERHHDLFADIIKKPTIYYQLDRLAQDGYLEVRREAVEAPGTGYAHEELAPRERDVYYITDKGRQRFLALLRETLEEYSPTLSGVDACFFFLSYISTNEAVALLEERRQRVAAYRALVLQETHNIEIQDDAHQLVNDHKLALLDAELAWLARTIEHLSKRGVSQQKHA